MKLNALPRVAAALALANVFLSAPVARAQETAAPGPIATAVPVVSFADSPDTEGRTWASTEYLLRWFKNSPLVPLVTTGSPTDFSPGALGQPHTRVLFGGSDANYGAFSGLQVTVGTWLNPERTYGVEASGFLLQQRSVNFAARSDGVGNPPIYVPVFRAELGREGSFTISDPLLMGGLGHDIAVSLKTQFWGTEANGVFNLARSENASLDLLLGFRYLDLAEDLHLDTVLTEAAGLFNQHEGFNTRNQFYGGQIGAKLGIRRDVFTFDAIGKVALGSSQQMVDTFGSTVFTAPGGATTTFRGAIFTQPTNLGHQSGSQFAVAPEVELKLGVRVTRRLTAFVGYDFLYLSSVVRPGDQIDRSVNETQSTGAPLIGPARPAPLFQRTDFYSHGVNLGLEFTF